MNMKNLCAKDKMFFTREFFVPRSCVQIIYKQTLSE